MNITKSSSIATVASVSIDGILFTMTGAFATVFQTMTLQNDIVIPQHIYGRNFTKFELDGLLVNPTFINGSVAFSLNNGTQVCPVQLRRIAGK